MEKMLIEYEGPSNCLVWKHPVENFLLGSELIVHESERAILFKDGVIYDSFLPGRYELLSNELPLLDNALQFSSCGNELIRSDIYFIKLNTLMGVKWGTDSKVRLFDPYSGLHVELGACGEFNVKVTNPKNFLLRFVGTGSDFKNGALTFDQRSLTNKFRALIVSQVKSLLPLAIRHNEINILAIDEYITDISEALKTEINYSLEEYGLLITEFFITNILTPDDDPNYRKMKEQYAEEYLCVRDEEIKKNVAIAKQERKLVEAETGAQEALIKAKAASQVGRMIYGDDSNHLGDLEIAWDCDCGRTNNHGRFCPNCGKKSPYLNDLWDCPCGKKNIMSRFCPNCGTSKEQALANKKEF